MAKKFKTIEKNAKNLPSKKVENLEWEGETVQAESKVNLQDDRGTGKPIVLRFFEFGVNPQAFKDHKPTAQELFNTHIRGMESLIWSDGLIFCKEIEPKLWFSKDNKKYRFMIGCLPVQTLIETPNTLAELAK